MDSYLNVKNTLLWIHTSNILLVFLYGVSVFTNSTFLSTFVGDKNVSLIFTAGSIATILGLFGVLKILPIIGNYKTTLYLLILEILSLSVLALSGNFAWILPAYILHFVITALISFNIDIFIESYSKDSTTGETRGITYALASIAWILTPLLAGFILGSTDFYWKVYAVGLLFAIPLGIILILRLKDFKDPVYHKISFIKDLITTLKNKDERNIFFSAFVLKLFFAWMVIYTPIYLHEFIGFDFGQIGIIFTVMMIPYILIEWPVGIIEDKWYGEKEILMVGFFVIAASTALLSFIEAPSILLWAAALFMTRAGAALVEISTESYFFKKISGSDTDDISFWRMLNPLGYLFAPLIGYLFLSFFDMRYIFVAIALIMMIGIIPASRIKDTL